MWTKGTGLNQSTVQNILCYHHVVCVTLLAFNSKTLTFNFKVSVLVLIKYAQKMWMPIFFLCEELKYLNIIRP